MARTRIRGLRLITSKLPGKQSTTSSAEAPQAAVVAAREPRARQRGPAQVGLHRRISLFVGLGLVICLATFGLLGVQAVSETTDRELQGRLQLARLAAAEIDRTLLATLRSLETRASTSGLDPANPLSESSLRALRTLHGQLDPPALRLSLIGRDGTILATQPADPALIGQSLLHEPHVAKVIQNGKSGASALRTTASDKHVVSLTAPIYDGAGRLIGALSGDFDLTDPGLLGFLQPMHLSDKSDVRIVDDQGNVLSKAEHTSWGAQVTDRVRYAQLVQRGEPTVGICHDCHAGPAGMQRKQDVIAFAPLSSAPWGVVMREPAEETFATANELRGKMVAFGVFLLVGGLLLAQVMTRSVVKPIESLTRAAQRIAKGDLASSVPAVGHSEIAVLSGSLDEMREQLRRSVEEIERWNESLEQRVIQRTRELSSLLRAAHALTSTLDIDTLLTHIVTWAAETFKTAHAGALMLYDRSQDQLVVRSVVGYDGVTLRGLRLRPGEGIPGKVFAAGRERLYDEPPEVGAAMADLRASNQQQFDLAAMGLPEAASCICAPLITKNQPLGCVFLVSPTAGGFSDSDLRLLRAMADQAAVAVENAQLYEEVRRSEQARGELLGKLIGAQEEERRRIARELHDETSQALTALVLSLAQLRKITPSSLQNIREGIDEIESLAGLTLDEIHRLTYDLRPTLLDDLGLVPAIQWCLETHAQKAGIEIKLELDAMEERLPAPVETVLFRIIQEAVTNIVRHSAASTAIVRVRRREGGVVATIEDDGRGFDARATMKKGTERGLGLLGMKERVNLLDGKFSIVSRPGRGTKLSVEVPVATKDREYDPSVVG